MHNPIDRRRGRHGVFEDLIPLREDQVRRDYVELESFFGGLTSKAPEAPVFLNN
jgi:hypothetical protein